MADYRDNLRKLAQYLLALPVTYSDFEMATFFRVMSDDEDADDDAIEAKYALENGGVGKCGAVACAVGHGPSAGFLFNDDEIIIGTKSGKPEFVDWLEYTERVFLPGDMPERPQAFTWMFGGGWSGVDNTPQGAGKRIIYFLDHGVPDDFYYPLAYHVGLYNA